MVTMIYETDMNDFLKNLLACKYACIVHVKFKKKNIEQRFSGSYYIIYMQNTKTGREQT